MFHGRANEDVDTWLAKVGDFLYLTEANPRQQVAYAATLLQEAAADWWVALLRERSGRRPEDFAEFTVLLCKTIWQLNACGQGKGRTQKYSPRPIGDSPQLFYAF